VGSAPGGGEQFAELRRLDVLGAADLHLVAGPADAGAGLAKPAHGAAFEGEAGRVDDRLVAECERGQA
jgi:hypothetical protein